MEFLVTARVNHTEDTLFEDVRQVPPATALVWDLTRPGAPPAAQSYWRLDPSEDRVMSDHEYARALRELLEDSIRLQLRSDVAIGTCLSGGLDSSSIVSIVNRLLRDQGIAVEQLGTQQRTFTSCFDDPRFDERHHSQAVVRHTGAEQNLVFPMADGLVEELPRIIWHQDEPFASTSIYAQWSVFRRVRERGVTVVLDGQGSDELFAGYDGYHRSFILGLLQRGHLLRAIRETQSADGISLNLRSIARTIARRAVNQVRVRRHGPSVPPQSLRWFDADALAARNVTDTSAGRVFADTFQERLYREFREGLPSLLRYEDRDSMAFSVEARVPFLDHRIVEFAFALPADQRIRSGLRKHVLREAMKGILPESVRSRRDKLGFATPEPTWLRTHLAPRMQQVLVDPPDVVSQLLDLQMVRSLADAALTRDVLPYEQALLWRVLNACDWAQVFDVR